MDFKKNFDLATLKDVLSLRMGTTVAGQIRKRVKDGRVAQMLDHFVQYVGSSPYGSPAVLCSIAHMQTNDGVWYPMGGTRAVPVALEKLARDLGVDHTHRHRHLPHPRQAGRVTAVETDTGETVPVAAVVSNMDSVRTYRELVGGAPAQNFAKRWNREPACSGVVMYLGLDRAYEHLAHHDFIFSKDPESRVRLHLQQAANRRRTPPATSPRPRAPSRASHPRAARRSMSSCTRPTCARTTTGRRCCPAYRQVILDKLARCAGMPDLESRIKVERILTPQDIHDRYSVLDGAIYGLASHGRMFGAFKPGNRSRELGGLYLAGGAAHPGPGMPMVLMSGWIAADTLDADVAASALAKAG